MQMAYPNVSLLIDWLIQFPGKEEETYQVLYFVSHENYIGKLYYKESLPLSIINTQASKSITYLPTYLHLYLNPNQTTL